MMRIFKVLFNIAIILIGILLAGSLIFYNLLPTPESKKGGAKTEEQETKGFFEELKDKVANVFTPSTKKEEEKSGQQEEAKQDPKQKLLALLPTTEADFGISSLQDGEEIKGFLVTTIMPQGRQKAEEWLKGQGFSDLSPLNLQFKTSAEIQAIPQSYN